MITINPYIQLNTEMKKTKIIKSLGCMLCSILLIMSCADKYSETDMHGKWSVSEWKVESTGKLISNKMDMDFQSDGQYTIDYGTKKEQGKYWIAGDYLHTVADGKSEMSVKIMKLSTDTLEIQMNRGGEMEKVLLLHE
jgi:hypothetical protein